MRRTVVYSVLFALLVAAQPVAFAASAVAHTQNYRIDGKMAGAIFFTDSEDGCESAQVSVTVYDTVQQQQGQAIGTPEVVVFISRADYCNWEFGGATAIAPIGQGDLRITGGLGRATLRTTVEAIDWVTGAPFPLEIDLAWTADSPIVKSSRTSTQSGGGYMTRDRSRGSERSAVPTGTIFDAGVDLTAGTQGLGFLSQQNQGTLNIHRPQTR